MKTRFQHTHVKMTFLVCYAPTKHSNDDANYAELSKELVSVFPNDIGVLLGDFNATVRNDTSVLKGTRGRVTPGFLNDNVLRLTELCISRPCCCKEVLPAQNHSTIYKVQQRQPHQKMADYVIISKHWRSSLRNCRTRDQPILAILTTDSSVHNFSFAWNLTGQKLSQQLLMSWDRESWTPCKSTLSRSWSNSWYFLLSQTAMMPGSTSRLKRMKPRN